MKPLKIYILHLLILNILSILFTSIIGQIYHVRFGITWMQYKIYMVTNAIGCLSLFLFYIKPALKSKLLIILIHFICFMLVSFFGSIALYSAIWYSNIPEMVVTLISMGFSLNFGLIGGAFISGGTTAAVLMLKRKKITAGSIFPLHSKQH